MRCEATRRDGQPCEAQALPGRTLCWAHEPELRGRAREANAAGGRNRSNASRAARYAPRDLQGLVRQLLESVGEVHRGDLDPKRAQAMASLAGAVVRAYQVGEIERRLEELESRMDGEGEVA